MLEKILPYLPFAGLIIGAFLQYFFTRQIEYSRSLRELKSKAYMNYLNGVCELAQITLFCSPEKIPEK